MHPRAVSVVEVTEDLCSCADGSPRSQFFVSKQKVFAPRQVKTERCTSGCELLAAVFCLLKTKQTCRHVYMWLCLCACACRCNFLWPSRLREHGTSGGEPSVSSMQICWACWTPHGIQCMFLQTLCADFPESSSELRSHEMGNGAWRAIRQDQSHAGARSVQLSSCPPLKVQRETRRDPQLYCVC